MNGNDAQRKILIIGLDGGTWSVLDRFIAVGAMPRLKGLLRTGHRTTLLSTVPPITPVAWSSFATGMGPGRHGVFGFLAPQRDPGSYSPPPVRRDAVRAPSLWRLLSDAGLSTTVLSVPLTYPPEPVNGSMVTGMFTPESATDSTHPPSLRDELSSRGLMPKFQLDFTRRRVAGRAEERLERALASDASSYFADLEDMTERLAGASLHLMEKPWDLFVTVFVGTDRLQHVLWDDAVSSDSSTTLGRRIADFYSSIDAAVGRLVDAAGPGAVVVLMSDHGFGRCAGHYSMGRWLIDEGYARHLPRRTYGALRAVLDATRLKTLAARTMVRGRVERAVRASFIPLDWSRTRAYFQPGTYGIRVNLKGREREGIVEPGEEYETLRKEIRERVLEIEEPAGGGLIVSRAWFSDEIYDWPHTAWAPDIVLEPNPELGYHLVSGDLTSERRVTIAPKTRGSHRREGILLVAGPGVRASNSTSPAGIADIAPTVLWLLGQPVPKDMDGRVLSDAFDGAPAARSAGSGDPTAPESGDPPREGSFEDDEEIKERLRGLGYVD